MTVAEAWRRLQGAFDRARASAVAELVEKDYVIGGARTRLRVVGKDLAEHFEDSFFHLRSGSRADEVPDLRVDAWDATVSGIPNPLAGQRCGDVASTVDGGVLTRGEDDRHLVFERGETLTWLDRHTRRVLACRHRPEALPLIELAKPLSPLLPVFLRDRDVHTVHGALVATERGGALVAGPSGAGKSTCALLCVEAGFDYLGDDCVAIDRTACGAFTGHSLFASSRISRDRPDYVPSLARGAIPGRPPAEPKALLLLRHVAGAKLGISVPVRVLLLPRVARTSTTGVRPAGKAETFRVLAGSSFPISAPRLDRKGVEFFAALAERLPAYHLELGEELAEIPRRVREVLERAAP